MKLATITDTLSSIDEDALRLDVKNIKDFVNSSLVGPQGEKGDTGATGATGAAGEDGVMASVVAGSGISVDSTDPANPIVSSSVKAWVNFNGSGTVGVVGGENVSSVTDHDVGLYTVNFTVALADANYSIVGMAQDLDSSYGSLISVGIPGSGSPVTTHTSSACSIATGYGNTAYDSPIVNIIVTR